MNIVVEEVTRRIEKRSELTRKTYLEILQRHGQCPLSLQRLSIKNRGKCTWGRSKQSGCRNGTRHV